MSLLALESVSRRYRAAGREWVVLKEVSLELHAGELVVVYGTRRSGRTTLLRTAAGIQAPDSGRVRFQGLDLAEHAESVLGVGIGYVTKTLHDGEDQRVLEQVAAPLLARGVSLARAREQARDALARAGAEHCAAAQLAELSAGERLRVTLARALSLSPRLIVIDEPVASVGLSERDEILALLRKLAGEDIAVLASTGEPTELAGAHRALTLGDGQLRGPSSPQLATVVALRARSA